MKIGTKLFGENTPLRIQKLEFRDILTQRENAKGIKSNWGIFHQPGWSMNLKNVGTTTAVFIEKHLIWKWFEIESGDNARAYLIRLEYKMGFELATEATLFHWNIDLKTLMKAYFQDYTEALPKQATELNF